jgi:pyridoxine 4-dehydrogenase
MLDAFANSKNRLQKQPVDMLQLHWPPSLRWQESSYLEALSSLVSRGEARQLGMSNLGPSALSRLSAALSAPLPPLDQGGPPHSRGRGEGGGGGSKIYSNQVQFSLLSRQPLSGGLAEECQRLGVQPIAYSPLALGLLADKYSIDRLPKGPRAILFREYLPAMAPLLGELRDIAKTRRKTVSQVTRYLSSFSFSFSFLHLY